MSNPLIEKMKNPYTKNKSSKEPDKLPVLSSALPKTKAQKKEEASKGKFNPIEAGWKKIMGTDIHSWIKSQHLGLGPTGSIPVKIKTTTGDVAATLSGGTITPSPFTVSTLYGGGWPSTSSYGGYLHKMTPSNPVPAPQPPFKALPNTGEISIEIEMTAEILDA